MAKRTASTTSRPSILSAVGPATAAQPAAPAVITAPAPVVTAVPPLPVIDAPAPARASGAKAKKPLVARLSARVLRTAVQFERMAKVFAAAGNDAATQVGSNMAEAALYMREAHKGFAALPADVKLVKGGGTQNVLRELAVGDTVELLEKQRAKYADILDAADMAALEVTKVVGKRIQVKASDGTRMVFHSNLLRAAGTAERVAAKRAAAEAKRAAE